MTIDKPWVQPSSAGFSPVAIIAWLKSALKLEVPVGYQDETGFHVGVKTAEQEVKFPATW